MEAVVQIPVKRLGGAALDRLRTYAGRGALITGLLLGMTSLPAQALGTVEQLPAPTTYLSEGVLYEMRQYTPVTAYLNPYTGGEYRIDEYTLTAATISFDYDDMEDTYTIYDSVGPYQKLKFLDDDRIDVEETDPQRAAYSDIYTKREDGYFYAGDNRTLKPALVKALEIFRNTDEYERGEIHEVFEAPDHPSSSDSTTRTYTFAKNSVQKEDMQDVYRPRWKMVNMDDDNDWISFDYNPDTDYFTMYDPSDDTPYAKRRFVSLTRIDTVRYRDPGVPTGIYDQGADGSFYGPGHIAKFITDGMLIFYTKLR